MKMYCSECGTRHEYAGKKPNFCTNCGYSFAGASKHNIPKQEEIEELEENVQEVPDISGLQVEIEPYAKTSIKISDAVDYSISSPEDIPKPMTGPKGKRMTKKAREEFLKDWQKEAGTDRSRNE